jgi:phosphoglycolate phosphatase-like HAD superfamily hydrolase
MRVQPASLLRSAPALARQESEAKAAHAPALPDEFLARRTDLNAARTVVDGAAFTADALEKVRARTAGGLPSSVVFDIDDTLADSRSRTLAIALAFDEARGTNVFETLRVESVDYPPRSFAAKAGLSEAETAAFLQFWQPRFFDAASMRFDTPITAMVNLANQAASAGAHVVFLTGRDEQQRGETLAELSRLGLQSPSSDALVMFQPGDGRDFKALHLKRWADRGDDIGFFITDSRDDVVRVQSQVEGVPAVLFDSPLSRGGAPVPATTPVFPFEEPTASRRAPAFSFENVAR